MPREFIPNVDDANAEVVRLDSEIARITGLQTTGAADVIRLTDEVTRLTGLHTIASADVVRLTSENGANASSVLRLQGELITEKAKATKTIAKAGVKLPVTENPVEGHTEDANEPKLQGLQLAIQANIERQNKAKA